METESVKRPLPSAVFFDLAGTLIGVDRRQEDTTAEVRLLPGLQEAVGRLPGVPLFIVTNHAEVTPPGKADAGEAVERSFAVVHEHLGDRITAARCCPHPPESGCPGHKPAPGLITDLAAAHGLDLSRAWYVGDTLADRECARRAGVGQFHWAQTFFAPAATWVLGVGCSVLDRTDPSDPSDPTDPPQPPTPNAQRPTPNTQHPPPAILPATDADLPAIVRIYNEAIEERISTCDLEPVTVAARRPWFERFNERHPLHIAVAGETVIGWSAILRYDPKPGYDGVVEHSIYVAREARGAGLGRRLLEHLLRTAAERGHRCTMGRIFRHNDPSLQLHRRLGFAEVGVLPRVALLDGRPADVVIMLREL